jgi:glycosyltransferase involved in cell wall biosynthesis
LKQQVERLGLSHAVRLVGFHSDVFPFYFAADVVVLSSIEPEPFGMVLVEAMTCAKPVVATKIGAAQEIVESGVTGLLVPPQDAEHLAQAIETLLSDSDRRLRMGQAGAARVRDYFSAQRMVHELQAIYDLLVGETVPL